MIMSDGTIIGSSDSSMYMISSANKIRDALRYHDHDDAMIIIQREIAYMVRHYRHYDNDDMHTDFSVLHASLDIAYKMVADSNINSVIIKSTTSDEEYTVLIREREVSNKNG